jgi:apolipoprotein N-acyltransferase
VSGVVGSLYRRATAGRPVNVGYVQGNAPGGGIYGLGEPRSITRNHLAETRRLSTRVAAGELPAPEVVIWPENGTDMDPLRDAPTGLLVRAAVADAGVPLMLGTISDGPEPRQRQTTSLVWDPVTGPGATYHKRNLVPFGEWVPYREVLEPLFPVVAYVGAQSVPGTGPGVLAVPSSQGGLRLGTMICYEVAFDETVHQTVTGGAEVLVVQSSNAMYVGTGQVHQQFAITRARAAELRRDILVVTVTGISGLIRADGSTAFTLPEHQPASGVVTLQISDVITPAAAIGGWLEPAGALLAAAGLALSVVARRRPTAPLTATSGVAEA